MPRLRSKEFGKASSPRSRHSRIPGSKLYDRISTLHMKYKYRDPLEIAFMRDCNKQDFKQPADLNILEGRLLHN